jgi:hypothetical protein
MSLSKLARASKIDTEVANIETEVRRLTITLEALFLRAVDFTAFMSTNEGLEFSQEDRDKYTDKFALRLSKIAGAMGILEPLQALETDVITVEQFLAAHTGIPPAVYSQKFD